MNNMKNIFVIHPNKSHCERLEDDFLKKNNTDTILQYCTSISDGIKHFKNFQADILFFSLAFRKSSILEFVQFDFELEQSCVYIFCTPKESIMKKCKVLLSEYEIDYFITKEINCDFILGFIHSILDNDQLIQTSLNQPILIDGMDTISDTDKEDDYFEEDPIEEEMDISPDDTTTTDEEVDDAEDDLNLDDQEPDDEVSQDFDNKFDDDTDAQVTFQKESESATIPHRKRRRLKIAPFIFSIVFLSGVGWFFFQQYQSSQQIKTVEHLVVDETFVAVPVNIFKVSVVPFVDTLFAVGTITGILEVDLIFQIEGRLEKLYFKEASLVESGDVIASLQQDQSLIRLKNEELSYKRHLDYYKAGGISKVVLDEANTKLKFAKLELQKTVLVSPISGVFSDKSAEVGEYVNTQKKIGTLIDIESVLVRFGIIEKHLTFLYIGQSVIVNVDSYPDQSFLGVVAYMSPIIQGKSKTLTVEAKIENKDKLLLPGMFTRTKVVIYENQFSIVLPNSAIETKDNQNFVYLATPDNRVELVPVEIGYASVSHSVISAGLEEEDYVIVQRPHNLKADSKIKIVDIQTELQGMSNDL